MINKGWYYRVDNRDAVHVDAVVKNETDGSYLVLYTQGHTSFVRSMAEFDDMYEMECHPNRPRYKEKEIYERGQEFYPDVSITVACTMCDRDGAAYADYVAKYLLDVLTVKRVSYKSASQSLVNGLSTQECLDRLEKIDDSAVDMSTMTASLNIQYHYIGG